MATGQDAPTANEKPRFGAADDPQVRGRLLLRINEAADVLGIGRTTVYELVANGELPVVRIGRSVRDQASRLGGLGSQSRGGPLKW